MSAINRGPVAATPPVQLPGGGVIAFFESLDTLNAELRDALRIVDPVGAGWRLYDRLEVHDSATCLLALLERLPQVESAMLYLLGKCWMARIRDADTLLSSYGCHAQIEIALAVAVIAFAERRK